MTGFLHENSPAHIRHPRGALPENEGSESLRVVVLPSGVGGECPVGDPIIGGNERHRGLLGHGQRQILQQCRLFLSLDGGHHARADGALRGPDAARPRRRRKLPICGHFGGAGDAKYREIRVSELVYRTGKLSEADWRGLDRGLRAEAVDILRRLDELPTSGADERS